MSAHLKIVYKRPRTHLHAPDPPWEIAPPPASLVDRGQTAPFVTRILESNTLRDALWSAAFISGVAEAPTPHVPAAKGLRRRRTRFEVQRPPFPAVVRARTEDLAQPLYEKKLAFVVDFSTRLKAPDNLSHFVEPQAPPTIPYAAYVAKHSIRSFFERQLREAILVPITKARTEDIPLAAWALKRAIRIDYSVDLRTPLEIDSYPETPPPPATGPAYARKTAFQVGFRRRLQPASPINSSPATPAGTTSDDLGQQPAFITRELSSRRLRIALPNIASIAPAQPTAAQPPAGIDVPRAHRIRFDRRIQRTEINEYPATPAIVTTYAAIIPRPAHRVRFVRQLRRWPELDQYTNTSEPSPATPAVIGGRRLPKRNSPQGLFLFAPQIMPHLEVPPPSAVQPETVNRFRRKTAKRTGYRLKRALTAPVFTATPAKVEPALPAYRLKHVLRRFGWVRHRAPLELNERPATPATPEQPPTAYALKTVFHVEHRAHLRKVFLVDYQWIVTIFTAILRRPTFFQRFTRRFLTALMPDGQGAVFTGPGTDPPHTIRGTITEHGAGLKAQVSSRGQSLDGVTATSVILEAPFDQVEGKEGSF